MPRECDAVEVLERKGGAHAPTTPNTPRLADRRRAHLSPATLVQAAYVGGHFAVECLGEPMELMWADMRPSLRAMMPRQAQASALALSFPLKAAGIPNSEALTLILLGALVSVPSRGPVAHAGPTSHHPSPLPPQITCIGGCSFYSLALAVQRKLMERGEGWVSVSPVNGEHLLRCVFANPELTLSHCTATLESIVR